MSLNPKQFTEVYRGFSGVSPETLDTGRLGRHWTTNKQVAESFANDTTPEDEPSTVVVAHVRNKHIIPRDTEEWSNEAENYGALWEDAEREVTVRPGSRMHVMAIYHYPDANSPEESTRRGDMSFGQLRKYRA